MSARLRGQRFRQGRFYHVMYERGVLYFALSFFIPVVIMLYAFSREQIHPFGDRQMLVVDLWHQYYPFFRVEREKLLTGGSFLYSWQNGLGTNFLSLISYYAASPLNWISVFFNEAHVRDALTYILIAKIGFAGAFFSCFLRYTYRRRDFSVCIFSSMFALCSYMLGYYWNVMWFDTVALFPLVMMGIVALCREGKWKTFTLALAVSLAANYYIAYFTCIFSVFMFLSAGVIECRGVKQFIRRLIVMIRSSLLGAGLAGFMLLPAYCGLQLTYSVNNKFPKENEFYHKWRDIFANLLSYSNPAFKETEALPNFACGMLAVTLIGVFLFSKGIKIREKVSTVLMLALITVSCNWNKLNFIWHGFHFTNMIPYRFAFIFCFVLVAAAFRAYDAMQRNGIKLGQLAAMLLGPLAVFFLKYLSDGKKLVFTGSVKKSAIITAVFLLIFAAAKLVPLSNKKLHAALMNLFIFAALMTELTANAVIGARTVGTSGYSTYPTREKEVSTLLAQASEMNNPLFYRTEMTSTYTLNDSALYGYYGISQFSSAANVSVSRFARRIGLYASEAGNRYYYRTSTPVVNSLLGIRYIISRSGAINSEDMALQLEGSSGSVMLYRNKYPLSLGFMMNEDILELPDKAAANPFEYQNQILKLATGISDSVFKAQRDPISIEYNNLDVTQNGYGSFSYTRDKDSGESSIVFKFYGVADGYLYGYASNGGFENITVNCDNSVVDNSHSKPIEIKDYPVVFPMGNGKAGSIAQVELFAKEDHSTGSVKLMVYALKEELFSEAYDRLADEQLSISSFRDTQIEGTVTAKKDGILFLSMPYEKGWRVYVDGEETETMPVMNAMLGARVSEGTHEIRIEYTPEGFGAGLAATFISAALCCLIACYDRRKARIKAALAAQARLEEELAEESEKAMENDLPEAQHEESQGDNSVPRD
ncbi:MAG: YfhO family protein [Ruminococcus sp.]|nr:YfhO family protein [Ruminococcus sp.]